MGFFQRFERYAGRLAVVALAIASISTLQPADAQDAFQDDRRQVDLEAQSLSDAIVTISDAFDVSVFGDDTLIHGHTTTAVSGVYTAHEALTALLAGTGLEARTSASGGLVLVQQEEHVLKQGEPQPVEESPDRLSEDAQAGDLDTVIVTGTRLATRSQTDRLKLPQVVDTYSLRVVQQQQARAIVDVIRNSPGVLASSVNSDRSPNLTIRGMYVDTNGNVRRNGVEFNKTANILRPNVAHIEVLKGPSSVVFGNLDPGGVINVVTLKPSSETGYRFVTEFDSFGSISQLADATGPLGEGGDLAYRLIAEVERFKSYRDEVEGTNYFVSPSLRYDITPDTTANLEIEVSKEGAPSDPGVFRPGGIGDIADNDRDLFLGEPGQGTDLEYVSAFATLEHDFADDFSVRAVYSWIDYQRDFRGISLRAFDDATQEIARSAGSFRNQDLRSQDIDVSISKTIDFHAEHNITLGVHYFDSDVIEETIPATLAPINIFRPVYTGVTPGPVTNNNEFTTETLGIHAHNSIRFSDRATLLLGLRYTDNKNGILLGPVGGAPTNLTRDTSEVVYRIGGVYQIRPSIGIFAAYSEGFAPVSPFFATTTAGEPLSPVEDLQYELGVKWETSNRRLVGTASIYHLERENELTFDSSFNIFQGGNTRSRGFEVNVQGAVSDALDVVLAYAYTDAEVIADETWAPGTPLGAPEHTFRAFLSYDINSMFSVNSGVYYLSDHATFLSQAGQGRFIDGYMLTEVGGSARFNDNVELTLLVKNVFDEDHFLRLSGDNTATPGTPLSLYGTLSVRF